MLNHRILGERPAGRDLRDQYTFAYSLPPWLSPSVTLVDNAHIAPALPLPLHQFQGAGNPSSRPIRRHRSHPII